MGRHVIGVSASMAGTALSSITASIRATVRTMITPPTLLSVRAQNSLQALTPRPSNCGVAGVRTVTLVGRQVGQGTLFTWRPRRSIRMVNSRAGCSPWATIVFQEEEGSGNGAKFDNHPLRTLSLAVTSSSGADCYTGW